MLRLAGRGGWCGGLVGPLSVVGEAPSVSPPRAASHLPLWGRNWGRLRPDLTGGVVRVVR